VNPFELLERLQELRAFGDELLAQVSPEWVLRAGAAAVLAWVLRESKSQGPPDGYAERLALSESQARALYGLTLEAAISRRVPKRAAASEGVKDAGTG
jgi:hypothetical protein